MSSPPPFLFLLCFRSQTLESSERKATSGNTMAVQALGDALDIGFSLKQRRWPASPTRTPQRPGSVHLQRAGHTASSHCRTLICKDETLPLPSDILSLLDSDSSCFCTQNVCGSRWVCFYKYPPSQFVSVDLGHCLSPGDPLVH